MARLGLAYRSDGLANRSEDLANRSEGLANRSEGLGAKQGAQGLSIKVRNWGTGWHGTKGPFDKSEGLGGWAGPGPAKRSEGFWGTLPRVPTFFGKPSHAIIPSHIYMLLALNCSRFTAHFAFNEVSLGTLAPKANAFLM